MNTQKNITYSDTIEPRDLLYDISFRTMVYEIIYVNDLKSNNSCNCFRNLATIIILQAIIYVIAIDAFVPWEQRHMQASLFENLLSKCNCNLARNPRHNSGNISGKLQEISLNHKCSSYIILDNGTGTSAPNVGSTMARTLPTQSDTFCEVFCQRHYYSPLRLL